MNDNNKMETSPKKKMTKKAMIKSHGDTRPGRVEKPPAREVWQML